MAILTLNNEKLQQILSILNGQTLEQWNDLKETIDRIFETQAVLLLPHDYCKKD
jgi:hypothetical protein